jgi:UDP-N-acetylmuramyl tripeptide synthase
LHHFGAVVGDIEAAIDAQRAAGADVTWELLYEGQLIAVFFEGSPEVPGRLELVSAKAPPLLDMFAENGTSTTTEDSHA